MRSSIQLKTEEQSVRSRVTFIRRMAFWLLNTAGWFLYAWIDILVDYRNTLASQRLLIFHFMAFAAGFLISIPVRYIYRALYGRTRQPLSIIFVVIATTAGASYLWYACIIYARVAVDPNVFSYPAPPFFGMEPIWFFKDVWLNILPFLAWSVIYFAVQIWVDNYQEKQRRLRAEELTKQAQLESLRYQINPHFLFNSLNSIRALVIDNPARAREMITDLAEFFRFSLTQTDTATIPLRNEIAMVTSYLAIEQKRFEEKLQVKLHISPAAEECRIPFFTIQPLIENAIKHGRRTSPEPLRLSLQCEVDGAELRIEVVNSGAWLNQDSSGDAGADEGSDEGSEEGADKCSNEGTGLGLKNLHERLNNAYSDRYELRMSREENSVRVAIIIQDPQMEE